jgi:hypothetical protein
VLARHWEYSRKSDVRWRHKFLGCRRIKWKIVLPAVVRGGEILN